MKKPTLTVLVIILILAFIGAYFLFKANTREKTGPEVKFPSAEERKKPEGILITIKKFSFEPKDLTVKVGETVTWINEDGVVHTVEGTGIKSPNLKNGDIFKFKFEKPGTYEYACGPHPYMTAKIVVQ